MVERVCRCGLVGLVAFVLIAGCEWSTVGDKESWHDNTGVPNATGLYVPLAGNFIVITNDLASGSTGSGGTDGSGVVADGMIVLGVGDGITRIYDTSDFVIGSIVTGSVVITDGFEVFTEGGGGGAITNGVEFDGTLVGNRGGQGIVHYGNGYMWVEFLHEVETNVEVVANYQSESGQTASYLGPTGYESSSAAGTGQGSTYAIHNLQLWQTGDNIDIYDNNQDRYVGRMGAGYVGEQQQTVYPFWANGYSSNLNVEITGWMWESGSGFRMRANWVEDGVQVGYIEAGGMGLAYY